MPVDKSEADRVLLQNIRERFMAELAKVARSLSTDEFNTDALGALELLAGTTFDMLARFADSNGSFGVQEKKRAIIVFSGAIGFMLGKVAVLMAADGKESELLERALTIVRKSAEKSVESTPLREEGEQLQ